MVEFINKLKNSVADKVVNGAVNTMKEAAVELIDTGAAKAAEALGENLGTPVANKNQTVIAEYQKKNYFDSMVSQQHAPPAATMPEQTEQLQAAPAQLPQYPVQPQVPTYPYPPQVMMPPYGYPMYPPPQMTVQAPLVKLDEDKVKRMAEYETDLFFKGKKIGKDVIKFAGVKFFSRKIEEDLETIRVYESAKNPALETAYKNAKYNVAKLKDIEGISYEDDEKIKAFIFEVILDGMMKKNEMGKLNMPSIWEVGLKDLGFFAYDVFTPNQSIELFLESLTEKFNAASS